MSDFYIQSETLPANQTLIELGEYTDLFLPNSYDRYVLNEKGELEEPSFAYKVFQKDGKLKIVIHCYPLSEKVDYLLQFPKFTKKELKKENVINKRILYRVNKQSPYSIDLETTETITRSTMDL